MLLIYCFQWILLYLCIYEDFDQVRLTRFHVLSLLARKWLLIQQCDPYLMREIAFLSWSNESSACGVLYTGIPIGHPKYLLLHTGEREKY